MNCNEEVKRQTSNQVKALKSQAEQQAFERRFFQIQIDLVPAEDTWLKGKAPERIESKITRIKAILDEFKPDDWPARKLDEFDPELKENLKILREQIHALQHNAESN